MTGPRLASGRGSSGPTGSGSALLLAGLGLALAAAGAVLPVAAAYVVGVLLCGFGLALALRARLPVAVAALGGVVVFGAGVALPLLLRPHTTGLTGEWETPAIDGEVLSGRALVSTDNTSVDLRTGRTVRLGSVTGGSRWVADDRMLVVRDDRVDSVRLDATARWTWRPSGPRAIWPLAAAQGATVLRVCPPPGAASGDGACRLIGVDARGRVAWATDAPGQRAGSATVTGPAGSLPRVAVLPVPGSGGSFLVDPATGRRTLVPDAATLAIADGPVVVTTVSGGRCVTSLYAGPSPAWTSVSAQACPTARPSRWFTAEGHLWVERKGSWERYTLAGGSHEQVSAQDVPTAGATGGWELTEKRVSLRPNPFRDSNHAFALTLRDPASGREVARLVTEHRPELLLAERGGVVVREDGRVTRYTLDHT